MKTQITYLAALAVVSGCSGTAAVPRTPCADVTPPVTCPNPNDKLDVTLNLNRNQLENNPENALNPLTACVAPGGKVTIRITPVGQPADPGTVFIFPKGGSSSEWNWLVGTNADNQTEIVINVPMDAATGMQYYYVVDKEKGCLDPRFHVE